MIKNFLCACTVFVGSVSGQTDGTNIINDLTEVLGDKYL